MKPEKYVYVNHTNKCVLVGTLEEIALGLEDWDVDACPTDTNDYYFASVDNPQKELLFWDKFDCKFVVK